MKVFSLTTVTVVIENETKGNITIGGAGKLIGSVGYSYSNQMFTMDSTPDGGYVSNFNGSLSGTVSIVIKQTSSHIPELTDFIKWCRSNPGLANSKITITDSLGNIGCVANGVFPVNIPSNSVSGQAQDRTFEFVAGEIIAEEINV